MISPLYELAGCLCTKPHYDQDKLIYNQNCPVIVHQIMYREDALRYALGVIAAEEELWSQRCEQAYVIAQEYKRLFDPTLVDVNWLLAIGFDWDGDGQKLVFDSCPPIVAYLGQLSLYIDGCWGPEPLTRGHVRRLASALNIPLMD